MNSISYVHQNVPATYDSDYDFTSAVEWLMKIVDTPKKGILINWSSTALFILLAYSPTLPSIARELNIETLKECAGKCADTILQAPILDNEEILWTPEAWSNGLVLWALSTAKPGLLSVEKTFKIAKWFKERIAMKELPTEDRAFSCIGLYKYLELVEVEKIRLSDASNEIMNDELISQIENSKEKLQENIAVHLKQRVSDFQSAPPFFSRHSFNGYYSVNIRTITVNVILILGFTFFLSFLTWKTQAVEDQTMKWFVAIPIVLGTLATVAQLANFTLLPKRKQTKINRVLAEGNDE